MLRHLTLLSMLILAVASPSVWATNGKTPTMGRSLPARTVHFDANGRLANYYISDIADKQPAAGKHYRRGELARGDLRVPANSSLGLKIRLDSMGSFSELLALQKNDIQYLDLANSSFRDGDWKYIKHLSGLTELRLTDTEIKEEALAANILSFPHLQALSINRIGIADKALPKIGQLKELERLSMDGNRVTNKGIACLQNLHQLHRLTVRQNHIDDRGLQYIAKLPLDDLDLTQTRITDAGLKTIAGMGGLTSLSLDRTKISAAGIKQLRSLRKLKILTLPHTPDGIAAAESLHSARPALRVKFGPLYSEKDFQ